MKYEKPEIVVFGQASTAIQSGSKDGQIAELDHQPSNSAYEADE
jgi:hypothetical protein